LLPRLQKVVERNREQLRTAFRDAFLAADEHFLNHALQTGDIAAGLSGACSLVAYISPARNEHDTHLLVVANAGDCRAVLVSEEENAQPLSVDHTPREPSEASRLRAQHPNEDDVTKNGRVKGYLEPSRGIGDGRYKRDIFNQKAPNVRSNWHAPYTTAEPDVRIFELQPSKKYFIVAASDGLWLWFAKSALKLCCYVS